MSKLSLSKHHDASVEIDGVVLDVKIRRMNMGEFIAFERKYLDYGSPERGSNVSVDTSGMTAEQAFFAVQKAEADRENAMTPADREAERARVIARSEALLEWTRQVVEENCSLPEGEADVDGRPVLTGKDIHETWGARQILMMQLVNLVWAHNRLPESIRKNLGSPSDSIAGSGVREKAAAGGKPEQIAGSASSPGSAGTADAAPIGAESRSGETIAS